MTLATGTSVDVVKAQLAALFEATFAADEDPVTVLYGARAVETSVEDRLVSIQGVTGTSQDDSLDGAGSFDERYRVTVVCGVDLPGAGDEQQQAITQAALALWNRCKVALRAAPDQAIDATAAAAGVMRAIPVAEFELAERADEKGRAAAIRWGVDVIAQRT